MKTQIKLFVFILLCTYNLHAQVNHLGFPNAYAYYPSLDYVRLYLKDDQREVSYKGYGFNNRGTLPSLLSLIFKEQKFFIQENIDLSIVGISMGNRTVKKTGFNEVEKSFSASILLGYNIGACAGVVFDDFAVGLNYTLLGKNFITDLEYSFNTNNAGLTELRVMVGPVMGQIGHSFNYKRNRMWNGMLALWLGDDPEEARFNIFLKSEYNTTLLSSTSLTKYNVFSAGITLIY